MRRTIGLGLELLEGRALLSGVPGATPGLVDSLTAIVTRASSGAQVALTFTETNASNHDITVVHGPSDEGFIATRGGQVVWNSNEGAVPQFLAIETLKPHQSLTVDATWDGRSDRVDPAHPWMEGPPISGTFAISNDLDHRAVTATVTIPRSWTMPLKPAHGLSPGIPAPVHALATAGPLG